MARLWLPARSGDIGHAAVRTSSVEGILHASEIRRAYVPSGYVPAACRPAGHQKQLIKATRTGGASLRPATHLGARIAVR
jgi:hypothetical protein